MSQLPRQPLALALSLALGLVVAPAHGVTIGPGLEAIGPGGGVPPAPTPDPGRVPASRFFPTGSVIFFHPDGAGLEHWNAARMFFRGPDRALNYDRLPFMAVYRGHMDDGLTGSSNGGATTHAFGQRVASAGSFGKDGDGAARPATDRFINALSGYPGSIMREAAAAGLPVGVINDGHVSEPGSGAFLAEVGNRGQRQEILRQMVQGRPGANDPTPWVILGGGEADLRPAGVALVHRNHNGERGAPLNAQSSLRTDAIDLARDWDDNGANPIPAGTLSEKLALRDDYLVIHTRADLNALNGALAADAGYAPHVLGLFAYQDLMNDRGEEELIARGKRHSGPHDARCLLDAQPRRVVGRAPVKQSCLILFGDQDPLQPGAHPPTFAEMTRLAVLILDRAARQQSNANARRFLLVAESEAVDNFGNAGNAIGMLQAIRDTDDAIGVAQNYLRQNPRTLILTAADSDAGSMAVASPPGFVACDSAPPNIDADPALAPTLTATGLINFVDGIEGRMTPAFVSEPDRRGNCYRFGILWPGLTDFPGGILSRAAGLNAGLLGSVFSERFDNIDVYRVLYATLFGRLLNYPSGTAPTRPDPVPGVTLIGGPGVVAAP